MTGDVERLPSEWLSATVVDASTGEVLFSQSGEVRRSTASVPKLLLLLEFAERMARDPAASSVMLSRSSVEPVADSGLWQHLEVDQLSARDVAALIGSVSDNLATNVLIGHVGLATVTARAKILGLEHTCLLDIVRDERRPAHPAKLSTGTTDELARLMVTVGRQGDAPGAQVLDWIEHGTDLSMVAHAFGLDPLSHGGAPDRGIEVWNKTGTDSGVRADVGLVRGNGRSLAYAAVANWSPSHTEHERDDVLRAMHRFGKAIRSHVDGEQGGAQLTFG